MSTSIRIISLVLLITAKPYCVSIADASRKLLPYVASPSSSGGGEQHKQVRRLQRFSLSNPICHSSFHFAISTEKKEKQKRKTEYPTSSYSLRQVQSPEKGRKINVCYLQLRCSRPPDFFCCCCLLRHTALLASLPLTHNVVVRLADGSLKLIKSIYHNYGVNLNIALASPTPRARISTRTRSGQRKGDCRKSCVCVIYFAAFVRLFLSSRFCVYVLIRRINWMCCTMRSNCRPSEQQTAACVCVCSSYNGKRFLLQIIKTSEWG